LNNQSNSVSISADYLYVKKAHLMNVLSKKQLQFVHGGSTSNAVGTAMFSLVGTTIGSVTGPLIMPFVNTPADTYSATLTNYVIDMKVGEYGIHSKSDAIGTVVGAFIGCFLGGVSWGIIN